MVLAILIVIFFGKEFFYDCNNYSVISELVRIKFYNTSQED